MKKNFRPEHRVKHSFLAIILLASCFTTACQPLTAELKNIPSASMYPASAAPTTQQASPARLTYEAPATCTEFFTARDDRVQINIDAEVALPEAAQIPVLKASCQDVSVNQLKKIADVLLEGKPLYEPLVLTKSELQAQIGALQKILSDPSLMGSMISDPAIGASAASMLRNNMEQYISWLPNAPDAVTPKEAGLEFHNFAYYYEPVPSSAAVEEETSGNTDSIQDQRENGKLMILQARLDGGFYGEVSVSSYFGETIQRNSVFLTKAGLCIRFRPATVTHPIWTYTGPAPSPRTKPTAWRRIFWTNWGLRI